MSDNFERVPVTIVEIDQDFCSRTYGTAPCTAAIGVTGTRKCFNTFRTCQDEVNFDRSQLTLRFCKPLANLPASWEAIPSVISTTSSPTKLNIGGAGDSSGPLGNRATVTIKFKDHPYSDAKVDPYVDGRGYNPESKGTFWSKFIARNPYYQNRPLRVRDGYLGQEPEDMVTRHYIIDGIDGPDANGVVTVRGIDVLRLVDDRRTKAPLLSRGELDAALNDTDTSFTVVRATASEYPEAGTLRIGDEVMTYTTREIVTVDGQVWNFTSGVDGWTATNATVSASGGILTLNSSGTTPQFTSPSSLTINGSIIRYVRLRIKRNSGSGWLGRLLYSTSGHGFNTSFRKDIPDTTVIGKWVEISFDMWALTAGGDDWETSTVTRLRLDLGNTSDDDFDIDWVLAGNETEIVFSGVVRGTDGTVAASHEQEDAVQLCLRYTNEPGYLVALDLIEQYVGDVYSVVNVTEWLAEGSFWLPQFIVSGLITEPTGINTLVSEIAEQCQFYIWWDERDAQVKLRANRPPTENPIVLDEMRNILQASQSIKVEQNERISQVWVYYAIRNPARDLTREANYARVQVAVDASAESSFQYGESKIRRIFSRWITSDAVAVNIATRLLNRYRDNPKYLTLSLDAKDREIWTADIVDVESRLITNDVGDILRRRYEVITAEETNPGEVVRYTLQSADFLSGRFGFWTPPDAPTYEDATESERAIYGFWAEDSGLMPDGESGYQWQ